jgi:regulator of cell morphogenesis and NO signaling
MQDVTNRTIREIAVAIPAAAQVFEEYRIDYCCGGSQRFVEACKFAGALPEEVRDRLSSAAEAKDPAVPMWATARELIDHILEKHHVETRKNLARIQLLMDEVVKENAYSMPELRSLRNAFLILSDEMYKDMREEEQVLFPKIRDLEISVLHSFAASRLPFVTIANPISSVRREHERAGSFLSNMRKIAGDYRVPEGASTGLRALYGSLEQLERDLHFHMHLENNLLFPMASGLEERLYFDAG